MKTTSLCRAILFDLDGTMVDTAPDIAFATNRMLNELGMEGLPIEVVRSFIGKGVPNLVRRALDAGGLGGRVEEEQALALFHQYYGEINGHYGTVYPGVREGLAALQQAGHPLGCVTNKPLALTVPLLASTGLDAFLGVVVAGDSIPQMKPDPAPLRYACRRLGADPAHSVMVGDSPVDATAARSAGMPVYIVRYGYPGAGGHHGLDCDGLIASFQELPSLLEMPGSKITREMTT